MNIAGKFMLSSVAAVALMSGLVAAPMEANAGNGGSIALGAIGGLAAGTIIGSALSGPRYYAPPPPPPPAYGYSAYYPAYAPAYQCVQRRVWGPYGWHWISEC